jgi:hypothetical protein
MAFITDLPTEILRLIFIAVADINLVDLFASRRTCKAFQIVITDILTKVAFHTRPTYPRLPHLSLSPHPRQRFSRSGIRARRHEPPICALHRDALGL